MFVLSEYYTKKAHSTLIIYRKGSYVKVASIHFSYSNKCKRKGNFTYTHIKPELEKHKKLDLAPSFYS